MKFPQFWLDPLANRLLDTPCAGAGAPPPKINEPAVERPPGGACKRVEERFEITLPQFWLAPLAKELEENCMANLVRSCTFGLLK
jgi:hypothetical protein